jgi:hypothetical protein
LEIVVTDTPSSAAMRFIVDDMRGAADAAQL